MKPIVPTIGLEVHVQLKTESKMFCSCSTRFGARPNEQVCPVCLGLPGSLPVLNEKAVRLGIATGLALGCRVSKRSLFHRKHYWYPDLAKNYQISQYDEPLAMEGRLELPGGRVIRVTRVHLEEDPGKLIHPLDMVSISCVDYNRSGMPLMEVVSEPDIASPEEGYLYLATLKTLLQTLDVSDCNMEEGNLRCDVNVSVSEPGREGTGIRVELKNINSFRAVQRALAYETRRQSRILEQGQEVIRETRLWDDDAGISRSMRSKEEAHDYRYFIEPDLPPLAFPDAWLDEIRAGLPELPLARRGRFIEEYGLPEKDAEALTTEKALADYFEAAAATSEYARETCHWIRGPLLSELNRRGKFIGECPVSPAALVELLGLVREGRLSQQIAKDVLGKMFETGKTATSLVEEEGLSQISSEEDLVETVRGVIQSHPQAVEDWKSGKKQAVGFLMGQVMRATRGAANPNVTRDILLQLLEGR